MQIVYVPIASPPTPEPSPGSFYPTTIRREYLSSVLATCTPSELLFISTTIAPLLKRDFLKDLPVEIALHIIRFIEEPVALAHAASVSKTWRELVSDDTIWRNMCLHHAVPIQRMEGYRDYKARFKSCWTMRNNWRRGGSLLRSHRLPTFDLTADVITSLSLFSSYVIVGLANSRILVFSAETGVLARTLVGHEQGVWSVWGVAKGGYNVLPPATPGDHNYPEHLPRSLKHAVGLYDNGPATPKFDSLPPLGNSKFYMERKSNTCSSPGFGQPNALMISGGCDKVVKVWDLKSGCCIHTLHGHTSTIRTLLVLPHSPTAVTGSRDGTLRVWNIQLGTAVHVLRGHESSVRCLDYAGRRVVSGSYDTTLRVWDVDTGECIHILRGHYHQIYSVAFDGIRVISGGLDTTIRIWDAASGACIALLQGHTALVCQLQLLPVKNHDEVLELNGRRRGSVSDYSSESESDCDDSFETSSSYGSASYPESSAPLLATASSTGLIIVFSLATYEAVYKIPAHDSSVTSLQLDEEWLVSGGNDGKVRVFETATGKWVRDLGEGGEGVWKIGFNSSGRPSHADASDPCDEKEGVVAVMCRRAGKSVMEIWSMKSTDEEEKPPVCK